MTEDQKKWEEVLAMGQDFAQEIESIRDVYEACQEEELDEKREELEQELYERPLSIEIRSGWTTAGDRPEAVEYRILLAFGGPAMQVTGQLGAYDEPVTACVEVQDWFKPWTEITTTTPAQDAALLWFASLFSYGGGE